LVITINVYFSNLNRKQKEKIGITNIKTVLPTKRGDKQRDKNIGWGIK